MTTRFARFLIAVGAAMLVGCNSQAPSSTQESADVHIERIDKEFDIDDGVVRIAIDNPLGEINVRGQDEHEVGVHAVVQRLPPRFSNVQFRSRRDGDTLRIEISAAEDGGATTTPPRADVAVYVPGNLALALTTHAGRIAAKRRAAAIEARSESGDIEVSSIGRLQLQSASGQIRAVAIGKNWQGTSTIATDTGRIVLLVPTFGDVDLEARTSGKLSSAFGLTVHDLSDGTHEAHARYGAGTSVLQARSASGEIVLEQLVLLGDDKGLPEDDD